RMKTKEGEMNYKVSAKATGNSKKIDGLDAKEMLINMEMEATDAKSGQSGSMNMTISSWFASGIAGYDEVREFHKKMGQKLAWAPGSGLAMGRPDVAKGMAAAYKEMAKLDGAPILQVIKMGGAQNAGTQQLTPEQQAQVAQAQQQAEQ